MKKKIISIILAVIMAASIFPAIIYADEITVREIVLKLEYDAVSIGCFKEGLAAVWVDAARNSYDMSGGKYGYIDKTGRLVVPFEYDNTEFFSESLAAVQKNGKWGFINRAGRLVVPLEYDYVRDFAGGLAVVEKNYKQGCIDKTGEIVIPIEYDYISPFDSEGLAVAEKDGKISYIDKAGNDVLLLRCDNADSFSEGFAAVERSGKWGFISRAGELVAQFEYDYYERFNEGLAVVGKNGKRGFINRVGRIVVPLEYDFASSFSNGLAVVGKNGKFGYIDKTGRVVVRLEYDFAWSFSDGLAAVQKGDRMGYIDKTGKLIVPCVYGWAGNFSERLAVVKKDGRYAILEIAEIFTTPVLLPTSAAVLVDGRNISFYAYEIDGSNYFKLRDIAYTFNGTAKQFAVSWDEQNYAISITSGSAYTVIGGEMSHTTSGDTTLIPATAKVYLDGREISLTAYEIDGSNYFKLRDLAQAFDFGVEWDEIRNTILIDTSKSYTP